MMLLSMLCYLINVLQFLVRISSRLFLHYIYYSNVMFAPYPASVVESFLLPTLWCQVWVSADCSLLVAHSWIMYRDV